MGWLHSRNWKTRQSVVDMLITPEAGFVTLQHAVSNNHNTDPCVLYAAHESTRTGESYRFIGVYLIDWHDGWGYKSMDCCMGPYASECPSAILNTSPPHNNDSCRDFHARCRNRGTA